MTFPLISVVIPAYNPAEYLAMTVKSVLNAFYQKFEIIVVDDASPDKTDEMMQQFDDSRIKYFVYEQNHQLPATRNMGSVISSPLPARLLSNNYSKKLSSTQTPDDMEGLVADIITKWRY